MSYSARPVSVQPPDDEPSSGASLRAALRNVPMLPAPANVDDLLARLDGAHDPLASRPLTAIVSDASVPEDEPASPETSEDDFFAPVAQAANANAPAVAPRPALRSLRATMHAARAGLLAGILLIGSTVLPMRDAGPPVPVETASMPRSDAEAMARSAAASTVPDRPDPVAEPVPEAEAEPAAERAADAAAVPSPQTAGEEPATEAASPNPQGGAQEPAPQASAAAPQDEVEPVPAVGTSADGEVAVSDVEASEPEQEAGAASEEEPELPQETDQDLAQVESGDDTVAAAAPLPPARPKGLAAVPFAGAWAVSAKACTRAMQKRGHLVADIDSRRAKAGGTTCTFKTLKRQGDTWKTAAVCSNGRKTWKSDVRLTLERGRLTWQSQKGSTTYVRCHA